MPFSFSSELVFLSIVAATFFAGFAALCSGNRPTRRFFRVRIVMASSRLVADITYFVDQNFVLCHCGRNARVSREFQRSEFGSP